MLFSYEELRVLRFAIDYLFENQDAVEEGNDYELDWELVDQIRGEITTLLVDTEAAAIKQAALEAENRRSEDRRPID